MADILPQHEFTALAKEITNECFPSEIEVFEIDAPSITENLYEGRQATRESGRPDEDYEFGLSLTQSLEFVKFLVGTFTVIRSARRHLRTQSKRRGACTRG